MQQIPDEMLSHVSGGLFVAEDYSGGIGPAIGGTFGGGTQYAGLWGAVWRGISGALTVKDLYNMATQSAGTAGSGGNENDNGGTSYGTGTYNTFGGAGA